MLNKQCFKATEGKNKKKEGKKKHHRSWRRPTFPQGDPAVLSAMRSLTARFEMELGITSSQ
jgi:hypothetical protein